MYVRMYVPYHAQSSRWFNFRAESMRENKTHVFRAARGARKLEHGLKTMERKKL